MDIVIRAAAAFVLVYVLLRVTGRRELSTLEPFDLILHRRDRRPRPAGRDAEHMSFYRARPRGRHVHDSRSPRRGSASASRRCARSSRRRRSGRRAGKPFEHNLRAERLDRRGAPAEAARMQQVASLDDVEWAIVEPGGQISIIPRA